MIVDTLTLNSLKLLTCVSAALPPYLAILPTDSITLAQKWGFGAFFFGAASLFYYLWKKVSEKYETQMNLRITERDQQISEQKETIKELVRKLEEARKQ